MYRSSLAVVLEGLAIVSGYFVLFSLASYFINGFYPVWEALLGGMIVGFLYIVVRFGQKGMEQWRNRRKS